MEFVSWDDEIPNKKWKTESHSKFHGSSHHQPDIYIYIHIIYIYRYLVGAFNPTEK